MIGVFFYSCLGWRIGLCWDEKFSKSLMMSHSTLHRKSGWTLLRLNYYICTMKKWFTNDELLNCLLEILLNITKTEILYLFHEKMIHLWWEGTLDDVTKTQVSLMGLENLIWTRDKWTIWWEGTLDDVTNSLVLAKRLWNVFVYG